MRLVSITVATYDVPLKFAFKHSSASRKQTETVIVVAESESGQVGYGEGCPRDYVTGETIDGARAFLARHTPSLIESVGTLSDLEAWIAANAAEIDANPAAFCAAELALLDLLGKEQGCPVEALLGLPPLAGRFQYSAVLGDSGPVLFWLQFRRYWGAGFRDFKLKLSGDKRRDGKKIALFRRREPAVRVRLDANNLWHDAADCIDFIGALDFPFFAIEEPLQAGRLDDFRDVAHALNTRIVLDESFLKGADLAPLAGDAELWLLNCRVSKLGGLIRSLAVARDARDKGIGLIVGAHVGETSLLTRAGLALAHGVGDGLVAQEGAFGTHLLKRDLCRPAVMFGDGGVLDAGAALNAGAAGLGLAVDADALTPAI